MTTLDELSFREEPTVGRIKSRRRNGPKMYGSDESDYITENEYSVDEDCVNDTDEINDSSLSAAQYPKDNWYGSSLDTQPDIEEKYSNRASIVRDRRNTADARKCFSKRKNTVDKTATKGAVVSSFSSSSCNEV